MGSGERAGSNLQLDRQQAVPASVCPMASYPSLDTPCSKVGPTQSLAHSRLGTTQVICLTRSLAHLGPNIHSEASDWRDNTPSPIHPPSFRHHETAYDPSGTYDGLPGRGVLWLLPRPPLCVNHLAACTTV